MCGNGVFAKTFSPWLVLKLFTSSINYAVEGILLGLGEEVYLTTIHVINFTLMLGYSFAVRHYHLGFEGMWIGMALYQCLRVCEHIVRFSTRKPLQRQIDASLLSGNGLNKAQTAKVGNLT